MWVMSYTLYTIAFETVIAVFMTTIKIWPLYDEDDHLILKYINRTCYLGMICLE